MCAFSFIRHNIEISHKIRYYFRQKQFTTVGTCNIQYTYYTLYVYSIQYTYYFYGYFDNMLSKECISKKILARFSTTLQNHPFSFHIRVHFSLFLIIITISSHSENTLISPMVIAIIALMVLLFCHFAFFGFGFLFKSFTILLKPSYSVLHSYKR